MKELTAAGRPRQRKPGAGRPPKHGEPTRSVRVPMSVPTELISSIPDLQQVLDYWEDECATALENSARHHFLKQCLEEIRNLGF